MADLKLLDGAFNLIMQRFIDSGRYNHSNQLRRPLRPAVFGQTS